MKPLLPLAATAAAAALTSCSQASAIDAASVPADSAAASQGPLEAGLWETSTNDETEGGEPAVTRICVGEDEKGAPKDAFAQFDDPDCKVSRSAGVAGLT